MQRYTLECDEQLAAEIEGLAAKYGLTEQEVIRQLVDVGLESLD